MAHRHEPSTAALRLLHMAAIHRWPLGSPILVLPPTQGGVMTDEIRAWAREQGLPVADRGRLAGDVVEAYEAWQAAGDDDTEPMLLEPSPAPVATEAPDPSEGVGAPEKPPEAPPKPRLFQRKPRTQAKTRKQPHKRVPVDNLISTGIGIMGFMLSRQAETLPVGRVLMLQSEGDGMIIEDVVKGTIVDKFLQPLARGGEQAEVAFAVIGPPLIVGAMTARPDMAPALIPMLKMSLMSYYRLAGPAMERAAKRAAQWEEEVGEVDIEGIINGLFAEPPVPMSPDVAEHARKQAGQDGTA